MSGAKDLLRVESIIGRLAAGLHWRGFITKRVIHVVHFGNEV